MGLAAFLWFEREETRLTQSFSLATPFLSDEDATDHVLYTTDEGLNWKEYNFGERIFVSSIQTVPTDTSRKFLLFGTRPSKPEATVSIHLDFSALTSKKCESAFSDPSS